MYLGPGYTLGTQLLTSARIVAQHIPPGPVEFRTGSESSRHWSGLNPCAPGLGDTRFEREHAYCTFLVSGPAEAGLSAA
jgi:hypothetical protein